MNDHFVYIIYSEFCDLHYFGHTNNLDDRLLRHNSNRNKFTKNKGPWKLISSFSCSSKSEVYRLEVKLKSFKDPDYAISFLTSLNQSTPI